MSLNLVYLNILHKTGHLFLRLPVEYSSHIKVWRQIVGCKILRLSNLEGANAHSLKWHQWMHLLVNNISFLWLCKWKLGVCQIWVEIFSLHKIVPFTKLFLSQNFPFHKSTFKICLTPWQLYIFHKISTLGKTTFAKKSPLTKLLLP